MKKSIKLVAALSIMGVMAITGVNSSNIVFNSFNSYAEVNYSDNWKIENGDYNNGRWQWIEDNGQVATNTWIHDYNNWYLIGDNGYMRDGIFKSYGKYYLLDTVRGTGTYGKLVTNGMVYKGITIKADTSYDYEGALSEQTIRELKNIGVDFGNTADISGTRHIENGTSSNLSLKGKGSASAPSGAQQNQGATNQEKILRDVRSNKVLNIVGTGAPLYTEAFVREQIKNNRMGIGSQYYDEMVRDAMRPIPAGAKVITDQRLDGLGCIIEINGVLHALRSNGEWAPQPEVIARFQNGNSFKDIISLRTDYVDTTFEVREFMNEIR